MQAGRQGHGRLLRCGDGLIHNYVERQQCRSLSTEIQMFTCPVCKLPIKEGEEATYHFGKEDDPKEIETVVVHKTCIPPSQVSVYNGGRGPW